jgi:hypothetical protein
MASVFKLESLRPVPRARALANPHIIYQVTRGRFAEIARIYSQFPNLDKLILDDNNHGHATQADIDTLPQTITDLCVISRGMDNIDLLYNHLPNLETLEVRYAKNPISNSITNLKNLKYLTVWWDPTDTPVFSAGLSACTKLETLEIHTKKQVDLSCVLINLPNLRSLKISALCPTNKKHGPAVIFPDNMHEFPQLLERLEIHTKYNIIKLPTQVSILPNLKNVNIHYSVLCNTQMLNNIDCMPNLVNLRLTCIDSPESIVINTNILYNIETLFIDRHNLWGFNKVRLLNPNFACNPQLRHIVLTGDCTQDFDNFPVSLSACKNLQYIQFTKPETSLIIPDEITQLPNLIYICIPNSFDIMYMPHPDKWPVITNPFCSKKCVFYSYDAGVVTDVNKTYYTQISPDCKCRNPYYYLDKWFRGVKCTCAQPGLKDKETGQILTLSPDMTIATYRAQVEDYIQRHQFTYPEPHPLLVHPEAESANATTANP